MTCKLKHGSLPFFRTVTDVTWYATEDGCDHYLMVIVALDPMAGVKRRYSVLVVNCQTGRVNCTGRELPLDHAREIAAKAAPSWGGRCDQ